MPFRRKQGEFAVLNLTDVSYAYKGSDAAALSGVTFSLEQGAVLGLLGINGAGKSTLVALLMGLMTPSVGEILIGGSKAKLGRMDVAFVPQHYAFYDELSVEQNLQYFAAVVYSRSSTQRKAAVDRVIAQCDLDPIGGQLAGRCSGGEKRRLNLALSLLKLPSLLILDEPTANVDPKARHNILSLVKALNEDYGITVIYTSHLLSEVQSLCDTIALIHRGQLVKIAKKSELIDTQAQGLTVRSDVLTENQKQFLIERFGEAVAFDKNVCHVSLTTSPVSLNAAMQVLNELNNNIVDLRVQRESLEDIFLSVVSEQG